MLDGFAMVSKIKTLEVTYIYIISKSLRVNVYLCVLCMFICECVRVRERERERERERQSVCVYILASHIHVCFLIHNFSKCRFDKGFRVEIM